MRATDGGLLAVIAAGGALGSVGRYAVALTLPHATGSFPWATFLVNVTGALAMGVLFVWVLTMSDPHPWLRPFLGVGVLGGWTTFSTFAMDGHTLVQRGHPVLATAYVVGSLMVGLAAVGVGVTLGERIFGHRR